jgi:hypothetical protein
MLTGPKYSLGVVTIFKFVCANVSKEATGWREILAKIFLFKSEE